MQNIPENDSNHIKYLFNMRQRCINEIKNLVLVFENVFDSQRKPQSYWKKKLALRKESIEFT